MNDFVRKLMMGAAGGSSTVDIDPYFENVLLLLKGNGTNGAQNTSFFAQSYAGSLSPGGYSVLFDGTGDYLFTSNVNLSTGTGNFTMEAWVFPLLSTQGGVILDTRSNFSNTNRPCISYVNSTFRYYADFADKITSPANYPAGQWYHVAVVRNSGTTTLYVNGTSVGTFADTLNFGTITRFMVAADDDGTLNAYFNGYVSNVRYVNNAVYTSNFTPTAPLTAISGTQLLTCQSATFVDNSPNNLDITRDGNTAIVSATDGLALTRTNNPIQGSYSPYGNFWSNYFDGTGDYLTAPSTTLSSNFTIEGWMYQTGGDFRPFGIGDHLNSLNGLGIYVSSTFETTINGVTASSASGTFSNRWIHFAIVRNGSTVTTYLDGVSVSAFEITTSITGTIYVGAARYNGVTYATASGYISNVRLVTSAVYTGNFTPPTSPLTAITNTSLLTCQSNRLRDASSNNLTITRNGDVSVQRFSPFSLEDAYDTDTLGGSAYFNGQMVNPDIVSMSSLLPIGTSAFTVEGWLYALDANFYWFAARTNGGIAIYYQDGVLRLGRFNVGDDLTYTFTWPTSQWVHIAVSRSGTGTNQTAIFINGTRVALGTVTSNYVSHGIDIGIGKEVFGDGYTGYLSDVRTVVGSAVYNPSSTTISVPTAPLTPITDTRLLCKFTNASIFNNAMMNNWLTFSNAQIDTTVKKFGTGSIKFDGDTDFLYSPGLRSLDISTGDFTIELWAYWNSYGSDKKYIISYGGLSNYWQFRHDSTDGPGLYISNGVKIVSQGNNTGWSTGVWYHVALVRNGSNFTIYRNGTSVATGTNGGSIGYFGDYYIGGMTEYPATTINGYIDEMRITRGVARYTSNFTPPAKELPSQ